MAALDRAAGAGLAAARRDARPQDRWSRPISGRCATAAAMLLRDAQVGEMARIDRGEGSEFDALAEWQSGMDRRTIDWNQSARHCKLLAARTASSATTRSCSRSMPAARCASRWPGCRGSTARSARLCSPPIRRSSSATGSACSASIPSRASPSGTVSGARAFPLLQRLAGELDYSTAETNFTLALATWPASSTAARW